MKRSEGARCYVKRIKGQGLRRICRDAKGRIKSNSKVRRRKGRKGRR